MLVKLALILPKSAGVNHFISESISPITLTSNVLAVLGISCISFDATIIFLKNASFLNSAIPMLRPCSICEDKFTSNFTLSSLSLRSLAFISVLSGPIKKFCMFDFILDVAVLGIN